MALVVLAAHAATGASAVTGTNVITTFAGTTSGFSGDGGPASAAQLRIAMDVAFDASGNAYIVDWDRIRKVDSSGTITTFAGTGAPGFSGDNGPATAAKLWGPHGIAIDGQGNAYIADTFNDRVRKVDSTGKITTFAGGGSAHLPPYGDGGPATSATLWDPGDVAVDAQGNVYITDDHGRIRKVDSSGTITTVAGGGSSLNQDEGVPATSVDLWIWSGSQLALDGHGNLYVSESYPHVVRKIDAGGIITTFAGKPWAFGSSGDCGRATSATLGWAAGLAADGAGNVYIATRSPGRVRKVDAAGTITTVAGSAGAFSAPYGDGGAATDGNVYPWGLAVDAQGDLYIADEGHWRVRKLLGGQTARASQTIVLELYDEWGDLFAGPQTYGGPPFAHNAAASSCLPLGFTTTGGCSVIGALIHITGAGTCTITASQSGNGDYFPAANVSQSFTINKAVQTITFAAIPNKAVGDSDFALSATSSSGLPVALTAVGSRCTVSGATVHIVGAGSCTIRARQAGDANYYAATDVLHSFTIGKASQTIAFAALPNRQVGGPDFAVSAHASSGLAVSFSASGQCTMSAAARVRLKGVGSCTVRASQFGDANYNAATPVARTFSITRTAGPTGKTCKVPNVRGKRLAAAKRVIKQRGCRTGKVRYKHSSLRIRGIVISQSRRPGAVVPTGTRINLGVSRGQRR